MPRFTIKYILFATTLIAAFIAVVKLGPTRAGAVMFWVYFALIFYAAFSSPQNNSPSAR
jgi:hypothetical protein